MYINPEHPIVQAVAYQIKQKTKTDAEAVEAIFYYVRDEILFGFHPEVDQLSASEIIARGSGQCNNKSIVFIALCQALNIQSKLFFSDIDRSIHRGFIPSWAYRLFPKRISHSWVEVNVDGQWHQVDGYINDELLFKAGRNQLFEVGWNCGYSVADPTQASSEFSLTDKNFVQMAAVTTHHGSYVDPAVYFNSSLYQNQPKGIKRLLSKFILKRMDSRVRDLRESYRKTSHISDNNANIHRIMATT